MKKSFSQIWVLWQRGMCISMSQQSILQTWVWRIWDPWPMSKWKLKREFHQFLIILLKNINQWLVCIATIILSYLWHSIVQDPKSWIYVREQGDTIWRLLGSFDSAYKDNEEIAWTYDSTSNKYSLHVLTVRFSPNSNFNN